MRNLKGRAEYTTASFTKDFIKEVDEYISDKNDYRSRVDFIRQCVREKTRGNIKNRNNINHISFCPYCGKNLGMME